MTVQELIDKLQNVQDKTLRVVVSGYESGYEDIEGLEPVFLAIDVETSWFEGKHQGFDEEEHKGAKKEVAIYIR